MGRLIGYGPGEIIDRLSILALKIQHAEEAKHFKEERTALLQGLFQDHLFTATRLRCWMELFDLAAINTQLWQAEDDLRANRTYTDADRVLDIAFRIQDLNDRRAACIYVINQVMDAEVGPEKVP